MPRQALTAAPEPRTTPPLGFGSLLALGLNGIVGVGIFFAPREVALSVPGWPGVLVYVFVALMLLPTGVVFARLGRAFPTDGGPYLYARSAFGPRAAFAVGWTAYVSALFSTATVVVGLVESSAAAFGITGSGVQLGAELFLLSGFMFALSCGLRLSAITWSVVTVLKSLPLLALPIAACFSSAALEHATRAIPPPSPRPLLSAALPVLFALQGFEIVPLPAAQVRNPARNVPLATLTSLLVAATLYVALHASCVLALPDLAASKLPLADAAKHYGGADFYRIMVGATNISALGIAVGMMAMTPRYLAALGHPDALGLRLDQQSPRAVPLRAFAVTYVLLALVLLASARWGTIGNLLALSSLCVTAQYAVTALALLALASRKAAGLSPRDTWPVPFALGSCVLLVFGSSKLEVPIVLGMLAAGFLLRTAQRKKRAEAA